MQLAWIGVFACHEGLPYMVRLVVPTLGLSKPKGAGRRHGCRGAVGRGRPARDPVPSGDEVFGSCDGSYAEYATAGEHHFAPKPTTWLPGSCSPSSPTKTYQVVWWIMAKLCVVVAVLVAFVAGPEGLFRSIP
jgi:hypothetical protein